MKTRITTALAILFACYPAVAQEWAKAMFDHTAHDFGVVARGGKAEHSFTLKNIYKEEMRISTVRSNCGCTKAAVSKWSLATWEESKITVAVDTRAAPGQKNATVTVVFAEPFPTEVQLQIRCLIRGDIVVEPESVCFGQVAQGSKAQKKAAIRYAGRSDWRIDRVEATNPHMEARALESSRGAGQVSYDLWVDLKDDAPAGYFRDQLVLVTNDLDARAARVPVLVEGVVAPGIAVRPPSLMIVLTAGETATRSLVVQGKRPFRILDVAPSDGRLKCTVSQVTEEVKLICVSFTAGKHAEKLTGSIRIQTDEAAAQSLEVPVQVQVVLPVSGGGTAEDLARQNHVLGPDPPPASISPNLSSGRGSVFVRETRQ